jgi:Cache 3/Cache 2 fusion domain
MKASRVRPVIRIVARNSWSPAGRRLASADRNALSMTDKLSAVGTALDLKSAAIARLNNGEAYYGDATVFGKTYDAGYEPIKDASGSVVGAYFVGQPY